uniref:Uncharacterized protein n=1 Tax=Helianthus annuus TaxID=4232 RepID=A0A251V791_HELAN
MVEQRCCLSTLHTPHRARRGRQRCHATSDFTDGQASLHRILLVVKLVGSVNEPKLVRLAHGSNLYVCGLTRRTTKSLLLKLFIWKNHDLFFLFVDYMVWN